MPRITCLRTIRIAKRPNLLWVEIETDEGLTGLGESFRGAAAVEAQLHEQVAPFLLGRDPRQIEPISPTCSPPMSASARAAPRCARPRRWTSRCGTSPGSGTARR